MLFLRFAPAASDPLKERKPSPFHSTYQFRY